MMLFRKTNQVLLISAVAPGFTFLMLGDVEHRKTEILQKPHDFETAKTTFQKPKKTAKPTADKNH